MEYLSALITISQFKIHCYQDFLGSPAVKIPHLHWRGHGFNPWLGPHATRCGPQSNKTPHNKVTDKPRQIRHTEYFCT